MKTGIANTKKKQIEGMKKYKGKRLLFPFPDNSKNIITMKGMKEPLMVTDNNGTRVLQPNEEVITEGQVIEERMKNKINLKLPKYQRGGYSYGDVKALETQGYKPISKVGSQITMQRNSPGSAGNYKYVGGGNELTNLPANEWYAQLVASGMTPEQFKANNGGDVDAYTKFYNSNPPTQGGTDTRVLNREQIPLANSTGFKSPNINIPPPSIDYVNPDNYKTPPKPLINKDKLKGLDLENIDLGYNAAQAFLNKRITPPPKKTIAHYTPETFRPHLQPIMDAGTTNMRNVNKIRGNSMSKNANIANVAMQRAAGTNQELNRVDNLNVDLLNNAQLKNLDIQGANNETLFQNAVADKKSLRDRIAQQSEVLANVNARVQGNKRDKAAVKLSQDQLDMMKAYYGVNNSTVPLNANSSTGTANIGANNPATMKMLQELKQRQNVNDTATPYKASPDNLYQPNITMPDKPVINNDTPDLGRLGTNIEQYDPRNSFNPNYSVNLPNYKMQLGKKLKLKFNK